MSDIREINGKYYDFGTKNKSFLQTAMELKTLGIKNYYFMLEIRNPKIADIDPYKPNITRQEIEALKPELETNVWYFCREVARVRSDAGVVKFELHRGLAAAIWSFDHRYDWCLNEPRQTWKTSGTIASMIVWVFQFSRNAKIHFFGKESENTKRNLATLKDDIDILPEWMQFKRYIDNEGKIKKNRKSVMELSNDMDNRKNKIYIHPKPASLSHAQGMARGATGTILYFDEIEHTPYFDELLSNSAPAHKTAADNAASVGLPYGRMFTTTPGNLDTREGMTTLPIIKSMIPWTEKIYDMTSEEIAEYKSAYQKEYHNTEEKREREVVDIFYMEYQYYQVRKTYEWVMEQYKMSGDKMAIRREILLQRLRGSNNSPINPEDIEFLIQNMKKSDKDLIINGKWRFRLYEHGQGTISGQPKDLDENIPYLVGIDPAAGGGGDNFAITLVNPYNLQIAAEFKNPYMGLVDAVKLFITLIHDHIPRGVLIPEKNSMGIYLIQALCETSIRQNLYWSESSRQLEDMVEESSADYELKKLAVQYKKYGTCLSKRNRDAMLELLFKHVNECKQILCTEYLVDDICKLVKTTTGRIEATKGEHDDCLFSYLHAVYIYYTGDNLDFFGIIKQDHPIMGPLEIPSLDDIQDQENLMGYFSTENITFETIYIQEAIRTEEEIKYLVSVNPHVHDEVYSKKNSTYENPFDGTITIPSHFFSTINDDNKGW